MTVLQLWSISDENNRIRGSIRTLLQIQCRSAAFVCAWVEYLFYASRRAPIKNLFWFSLFPFWIRLSMQRSKCWPQEDAQKTDLRPPLPPSNLLSIHNPPLPHLPHLSLQCCRSESVWRRGMYVHTNTGCAAIPPAHPNTTHAAATRPLC